MRTWAEINIDALEYNFCNIRSVLKPDTKVMSVVKADAYGHGYLECCKALLKCGTDAFAVATVSEAKEVRRLTEKPILVLGAVSEDEFSELIKNDIMPSVSDEQECEKLSRAANAAGKPVKIHIKIDTGMSRLGFSADDYATIDKISRISRLSNIEIDGIFSHLACADEEDKEYTYMQFNKFLHVANELASRGIEIPTKHIANSAAIIMYPEMQLDMVRPGIILYGYYPSDAVLKEKIKLMPVMSLKSQITLVKETEKGVGVSYGKEYITDKKTKIATVPIGYADGFIRANAKNAKMEIKGVLVPVIGRICMDQCMIDVTNVNNISIGDEVTVFGNGKITADTIAAGISSISYEVLCLVSRRVPRIYKEGGKTVKIINYLEEV